jgi:hypothetical protein
VGLTGGDFTSCPSGVQASWVDRVAPLRWAKAALTAHDPMLQVMGVMQPMMGDVAYDQGPPITPPVATP